MSRRSQPAAAAPVVRRLSGFRHTALASLLVAAGLGPARALDVTHAGADGVDGAPGGTMGAPGGAGTAGGHARAVGIGPLGSINASAFGGRSGRVSGTGTGAVVATAQSGAGGSIAEDFQGDGAQGGDARARAWATGHEAESASRAVAGDGGTGVGRGRHGGTGGQALATAAGAYQGRLPGASVRVDATASAGTGGSGVNGAAGGDGGTADGRAVGVSRAGGDVAVSLLLEGGAGGFADDSGKARRGAGGRGADASAIDRVAGATRGRLTLGQTVFAGHGGGSASGDGGRGGDALSRLVVTGSHARTLVGQTAAIGGDGGTAWGHSGRAGANGSGNASVALFSNRLGTSVTAAAIASGGQSTGRGVSGGSATADAAARGAGATYAQAGATSVTAAARATAMARTTSPGQQAYATSSATGPAARAIALSYAPEQGDARSYVTAEGAGARVRAESAVTGPSGPLVVSRVVGRTSDRAAVLTDASSATGSQELGSDLETLSSGTAAFAWAARAPSAAAVDGALADHQQVASRLAEAGLAAAGLGLMGAGDASGSSSAGRYAVSSDYHLDFAAPGTLSLGLLDFDGRDAQRRFSFDLSVSNHGQVLLSETFTSVASAEAYFDDRLLALGSFSGAVDLQIRLSIGAHDVQGAGFSYVLAAGGLTAPVPEPATWALLFAGLGVVGAVAYRRRPGMGALMRPDPTLAV